MNTSFPLFFGLEIILRQANEVWIKLELYVFQRTHPVLSDKLRNGLEFQVPLWTFLMRTCEIFAPVGTGWGRQVNLA